MSSRHGPCVYLSGLPRSMPRWLWKKTYRSARVILRESEKATTDVMLFGTGVIFRPDDGSDPSHIPWPALLVAPDKKAPA